MVLTVTVIGKNGPSETKWARELETALGGTLDICIEPGSLAKEHGQIIFMDGSWPGFQKSLEAIDRRGRAVFLILEDGVPLPDALVDGKVDDVLIHPFRSLEVLSKLRHYQQILMWDEVSTLNASFSGILERLHEDLRLAERLQKNRLPVRFPKVKGFKVTSRYLAGLKSGGDHFDLAENKTGNQLSLVMSDSSSYGLSSAVLSAFMKIAVKLSNEQLRSSLETVRCIYEELALTLGEKDKLSLFYGTLSRSDYRLKYVNLGTSCAFYARPGGEFEPLPVQGPPLARSASLKNIQKDAEFSLDPGSRLALVSDGFLEAMGGVEKLKDLLDEKRDAESVDSVNEMVFRLKKNFTEPDEMPAQDCTALILDADAKLLRLAG